MAITSVPIHTNPELRESRLFSSMFGYVKKSMVTIIRAFMMYKPMKFFISIGIIFAFIGFLIGCRFLYFFFSGSGAGHTQSLILASMMIIIGVQSAIVGLQGDIIAANRKLLEDIQYRTKNIEIALQNRGEKESE